ncbi:MAG: ABC transporter permease subunit [Cellulosilyticaceae bacterium]
MTKANLQTGKSVEIGNKKSVWKKLLASWQLYVFLLPAILYFVIFKYIPMAGVQIAFKEYVAPLGIWGSPWVGAEHFQRFFSTTDFWMILKNTIVLNVYNLIVGFPIPIILALMLNQTRNLKFKKVVQTTIYAPHFISVVVIAGMIKIFLSPSTGIINMFIQAIGMDPVFFMAQPEYFKTIYVISDVWQNAGYSTIVYMAALAAVGPELHESALVDGATTFQRIRYIDFPSILPTAITLLILNAGRMLTIGFEKIYLLQNELNRSSSEVISTYVYKVGFGAVTGLPDFSYAAAVGLFESVVSLIILLIVNKLAAKYSETSVL